MIRIAVRWTSWRGKVSAPVDLESRARGLRLAVTPDATVPTVRLRAHAAHPRCSESGHDADVTVSDARLWYEVRGSGVTSTEQGMKQGNVQI